MNRRQLAADPCAAARLTNASSPISLDSRVIARPHIVYSLREEGENVVLLFGSTQIAMPSFTRDAIAFALGGAAFAVSGLPGPLDDAGKIVLVRRLIREGLLVRT